MTPLAQQEMTQAELIAIAKTGDLNAFSKLMETLQPRLLAQAIAFCGDPELAKDLVQDAMISAWKSLKRYDGSCQLYTWLYVILQRQHLRSVGWFRRRLPLATGAQVLLTSKYEAAAPRRDGMKSDEAVQLRAMVSSLPQKHREVVSLRFYAEATEEETAAALGISAGTVKSRLHHALKKLRRMKEKLNPLRVSAHSSIERS